MSHVAMVLPGLDRIGGAEQQALLLAAGLCRRGWRVSVVALSGSGGRAAEHLRETGIAFQSLEMRKGLADPRGWLRLNKWLCREQPDVAHAHLAHAALMTRWSRLAAPVPAVIDTLHSSRTGKPLRRLGYAMSRWLPDHVTAVSQAAADSHLAAGMVEPGSLSVLSNGIDVGHWRPDAAARAAKRKELGLDGDFLWLAVGRLEPVKDYPTLLRAMTRLPQAARLVVLGAGPLESELRSMAAALGLSGRVRFAGFDANVPGWMRAADGLVLSSRWEGLPMALLEAGACEVPAVATSAAGTSEAMVHGETGWLAPVADPEGLAAAMSRLMGLPIDERRHMGIRARQHATKNFSIADVLDRWEQLYTELLERKANARRTRPTAREILRRPSADTA